MREKPRVGQIVYSLNVGNAARSMRQELTECEVTKVGRKYFSILPTYYATHSHMTTQYNLSDWKEKSTRFQLTSILYETKQEWEILKEKREILKYLKDYFDYFRNCPLSVEDLRKIKDIIEEA